MKKHGIQAKRKKKFKATTNSKHNLPVAPNLLNRKFTAMKPNQTWVGDITYIATDEGWLYLATWIDLFSRKIVGWSMSSRMTADIAVNAFRMALFRQKREAPKMVHSDRGSQYASDDFRKELNKYGCIQSMSRKGNCWDNAVAESFFGTLKNELVHHEKYKTREEARLSIFDYIEMFYNKRRIHSHLNFVSPEEFEMSMETAQQRLVLFYCPLKRGSFSDVWIFVGATTMIEYLAALKKGESAGPKDFIEFVRGYMPEYVQFKYKRKHRLSKTGVGEKPRILTKADLPEQMYYILRCGLVHGFSLVPGPKEQKKRRSTAFN